MWLRRFRYELGFSWARRRARLTEQLQNAMSLIPHIKTSMPNTITPSAINVHVLKMCRETALFQAGVNLLQDKKAWIKSSRKSNRVFSQTSKVCRRPSGPFHEHRSKMLGGSSAFIPPSSETDVIPPRLVAEILSSLQSEIVLREATGDEKVEWQSRRGWEGSAETGWHLLHTTVCSSMQQICCHK